jgi:hypothetical protein|tara:strand:- start:6280 stop:6483 length:204 start_codon:yes stop_codon:yes gene_type:complete
MGEIKDTQNREIEDNNIYSLDYRGETLAVIRGMEKALETAIAYEKEHGFEDGDGKVVTINLFEEVEE